MVDDTDSQVMRTRQIPIRSTPDVARDVLARYIGWTAEEVGEDPARALRAVMDMMRASRGVHCDSDTAVIKAMTWLLDELAEDHPKREELVAAVDRFASRC